MSRDPHRPAPLLPNARVLVALVELVVVAALAVAYAAFYSEHRVGQQLLSYGMNYAFILNAGEARRHLVSILVAVPAAMLLADASFRLFKPGAETLLSRVSRRPRWAVLVACVAAMALAELAARLFGHAQFTDDERIYLWEARNLLEGSFTARRPVPPEFFHGRFWFMVPMGDGRWGSTYPPGGPAVVALGMLLGLPHAPQLLCVGLTVWFVAKLAEDLWGNEASVLAAALLATSPSLILMGATLHNAVPTTLFCLLALWAAHRALQRGTVRHASYAGLALGAALVCRPLDAVLAGVVVGALLLAGVVRGAHRRRHLLGVLAAVLGGVPFVALLLASQRAVTGHALLAPFMVFARIWPGSRAFGFGDSLFGVHHTLDLALSEGLVTTLRVDEWLLGWPLALVAPLLVALGVGRDRGAWVLLGVVAAHAVGYFLYVAPAVHTFGSYYSLSIAPPLVLLVARFALALRDPLQTLGASAAWPLRGLAALLVASGLTFWPSELPWLVRTASAINAPIDAAERAAKTEGPIVVFHRHMQRRPGHTDSWVFWPPLASGRMDEPVVWAADWGLHNQDLLKTMPERRPMMLMWTAEGHARLVPWTPALAPAGTESGPSEVVRPEPITLPQPSEMLLPETGGWVMTSDGRWDIAWDPPAQPP